MSGNIRKLDDTGTKNPQKKRWVIGIIIVITIGLGYFVYSLFPMPGSKPDPCHCVELIERLQVNEKLSSKEMEEYKKCIQKYSNKYEAQSACWNIMKERDNISPK